MCIAQFNLYLVVLVVAILPITRPAIASHNLARFNPGIPGLSKLDPEIPGLAKRSGIAFPSNKSTKNLCKQTVLVQLIIEDVVTCFLRHSIVTWYSLQFTNSVTSQLLFIMCT